MFRRIGYISPYGKKLFSNIWELIHSAPLRLISSALYPIRVKVISGNCEVERQELIVPLLFKLMKLPSELFEEVFTSVQSKPWGGIHWRLLCIVAGHGTIALFAQH